MRSRGARRNIAASDTVDPDMSFAKPTMVDAADALPGRADPIPTSDTHFVNGRPMWPPYPEGIETAVFALGCFWGEEKLFWETPGVWVTAVGYAGGFTPNPTYEEVCTGRTGHAEVVVVAFDPSLISYEDLLRIFWEHHDPTQGMRQGNDVGTQYRSAVYATSDAQLEAALTSREVFQRNLRAAGMGEITTEIERLDVVYPAEAYHQQYLAKNPNGYCPDHSCGVRFQTD
jgi:peptide-methionine (S)-S-oxide reductase